eukprot:PITA_01194
MLLTEITPETAQNLALVSHDPSRMNTAEEGNASSMIGKEEELSTNSLLPISIKFTDLEYTVRHDAAQSLKWNPLRKITRVVKSHTDRKKILNGVTGYVASKQILALMGPSGSGKTTLLKIIGGRIQGKLTGSLTYNGVPYSNALKRRIGFVTQEDILYDKLTVYETLLFAAKLRLPSNMNQQQKLAKVETALQSLGLERCRNTLVGGYFLRGVSGGEKKRTCIACEILMDPSILLLDEPTSGLDSSTSLKLLQVLNNIAKSGTTIITTIHQPSSRVFHMFDRLLVISEGQPIFSGQARDAMDYFGSIGFIPSIPMNPADFVLDLATGDMSMISTPRELSRTMENQNPKEIQKMVFECIQERYKVILEPQERKIMEGLKVESKLQERINIKKEWSTSWNEQFSTLLVRTFKQRQSDYFSKLRLAQNIGVSLLLGFLWWKSEIWTEAQLRAQVGLLFYLVLYWASTGLFGGVFVFPTERELLAKERSANMYRLSAYYISSTLCDTIAQIFYATVFYCIIYFMANFQRTASVFFLNLLGLYLVTITAQGVGELIGAAVPDIKRTGLVASIVLLVFMITGGFYIQHMPVFIRWLKYVSFVFYGFRFAVKMQYSPHQIYDCTGPGGCKSLQSSPSFETMGLDGGMQEVWILILMAVVYRVAAYFYLNKIRLL